MGTALENARLFDETQEALAHQTASADILRVISSSPADVQPVFDAIVTAAVKHLGCDIAIVQICSGDTYSPKAMATPAGLTPVPGSTVMPVDPKANFPSRAIVSKTMLHVRDWSAVELPAHEQARHEQLGLNSTLYLPLLRGDACVGVLVLGNKRANAFNDKAIALAESFRDQAVIAIENVRLFNDTREALERQTATGRILAVMSGSTDEPARCSRRSSRAAGRSSMTAWSRCACCATGWLRVEANVGMDSGPVPLDLESAVGTCVLERRSIHVPDLAAGDVAVLPHAEHGAQAGLSLGDFRAAAARRRGAGHDRGLPPPAPCVRRQGRGASQHVRRPGRDRDRERAAVQRNEGGARAADGHRRSIAGDQRLDGRCARRVREASWTAASACSARATSACSWSTTSNACAPTPVAATFAEWAPKSYPRPAAGTLQPDWRSTRARRCTADDTLASPRVPELHEGIAREYGNFTRCGRTPDVGGSRHRNAQHTAHAAAAD